MGQLSNTLVTSKFPIVTIGLSLTVYRAMHLSAKRGIAIACRLSVCPSVCNVGEL